MTLHDDCENVIRKATVHAYLPALLHIKYLYILLDQWSGHDTVRSTEEDGNRQKPLCKGMVSSYHWPSTSSLLINPWKRS